ncbi:MAG: signal peptidase II [Anaerolineae bacterium]|nr:signal peptidase II [Anaerolineae bacterium]
MLTKYRRLSLLVIGAIVIAVDQFTKSWVRQHIPLYASWNPLPWLRPIVTLTHVRNTGAAFGFLPQFGSVFIIIALMVVLLIFVFYRQLARGSWVLHLALGLQLGGATGNLIDRLVRGYVTDFIDFHVWPVFNVADSSIVVGTALLAYYSLFLDREDEGEHQAPVEAEEPPGSYE